MIHISISRNIFFCHDSTGQIQNHFNQYRKFTDSLQSIINMSTESSSDTISINVDETQSKLSKDQYLNESSADIHFILKSGERIPAHKILLTAKSSVFEHMFNGSSKEDKEIQMLDVSADAFKNFLKFFYFNQVDVECVTMGNVSDMMALANEYGVNECMNICSAFLTTSLNKKNVCFVLDLALLFNRDKLILLCEEEINRNSYIVLQSDDFLKCSKLAVGHILQQNTLNCSEIRLFHAIMTWVQAKAKQETLTRDIIMAEIGDLFYNFRFRIMSFKEFVSLISKYGNLFTQDEEHEILQMIASDSYEPKIFSNGIRFRDDDGCTESDYSTATEDTTDDDDDGSFDNEKGYKHQCHSSDDENYAKFINSLKM